MRSISKIWSKWVFFVLCLFILNVLLILHLYGHPIWKTHVNFEPLEIGYIDYNRTSPELNNLSEKFPVLRIMIDLSSGSGIIDDLDLLYDHIASHLIPYSLDFRIHAFSTAETPLVTKSNITFHQVAKTTPNEGFIQRMTIWQSLSCDNSELFLIIQHNTILCPNSFAHLASIYQWAEMNINHWKMIRMGHDFHGILLQCRDVGTMIKVVEMDKSVPYEKALSHWWSNDSPESVIDDGNTNPHREYYLFRYILFEERDVSSFVSKYTGKYSICRTKNLTPSKFAREDFQSRCDGIMFSPCDNPIVNQLMYRTWLHSDIPLDRLSREKLLNRLSLRLVANDNIFRPSCNSACESVGMECSNTTGIWINNCDLVRSYFGPCRCINLIYEDGGDMPFYDVVYEYCNINFDASAYSCDADRFGIKRLCVCKTKSASSSQASPSRPSPLHSNNPTIRKFNKMMLDYYAKRADILDQHKKDQ